MHRIPSNKVTKAFTLIEMLIITAMIGILLTLLLPTLIVAKEQSHRKACLNNLKQLGIGIESYTADYAGFLPTWIGSGTGDWGLGEGSYFQCKEKVDGPCSVSDMPLDQFHAWGDSGPWVYPAQHAYALYKNDPDFLPNVVKNANGYRMDFLSDFRLIAFGSRAAPDGQFYKINDAVWPPVSWELLDASNKRVINYAPHGLGHLLVSGYIGDAKAYYCPSSKDMLPDSTAFAGGWSLAHWEKAGGFDKQTMLYANGWSNNADISGSHFPGNSAIFSNYAYRGVPFWLTQPWCVSMQDKDPCAVLQFTKPGLHTEIGSPLFRTRKQLGARALVSDAFSKACYSKPGGPWLDGANEPYVVPVIEEDFKKHPGMGVRGHRDAYNVLYGDGHATVYSDPEEIILWHPSNDVVNGYTPFSDAINYGFLGGQHWYPASSPHLNYQTGEMDADAPEWKYSSAKIWHDFDVAAGVDVF